MCGCIFLLIGSSYGHDISGSFCRHYRAIIPVAELLRKFNGQVFQYTMHQDLRFGRYFLRKEQRPFGITGLHHRVALLQLCCSP
ncbi:hypothetical protein D3C87_1846020 [compost metagenome]